MRNWHEISDDMALNHEINVTPFIDVILVLLIIFMVAAPLATSSVPLQLPVAAARSQPQEQRPVYISLKADGAVYLGEKAIGLEDLPQILAAQLRQNNQQEQSIDEADIQNARIFIRADKHIDYGSVMNILNVLRSHGYTKIGLVGLAQNAVSAMPPA